VEIRPCGRLVVLAVAWSTGSAAAGPPSDARIARQARAALERVTSEHGPGAAVLVARGTRVIYRGARGRAHIELGVPLSPDHTFRIASVTKTFTAATILKLAQAGRLSLEDPLANYLPGFPNGGTITLRHLLSHTAGVSDVARDPQPGFGRRDVDLPTRIAGIQDRPLDFAPGSRWAYSNSGYILLGAVIEKITGEPWHTAVQKQVLEPLALTRTVYGAHSPLIQGRVAGYTSDRKSGMASNAPFISMTIPASAGALASTVDELFLWMRALATGRLLRAGGFQQMITPPADLPGTPTAYRYGLGIYVWSVRGTRMVGHTGQIDGFAAAVGYLPEQDVTVVVLANDDTFDARVMGRRLAAIALGTPYPEVVAVRPAAGALRALEGRYGVDEATVRTLSLRDGVLFAQRGGGRAIPLQVTADGRLHFVPDDLSYFEAVRDAAGGVIGLDSFENGDGPPRRLPRIPPARPR
jgi:D-alanyl-D-alanine carboxypeptidase